MRIQESDINGCVYAGTQTQHSFQYADHCAPAVTYHYQSRLMPSIDICKASARLKFLLLLLLQPSRGRFMRPSMSLETNQAVYV